MRTIASQEVVEIDMFENMKGSDMPTLHDEAGITQKILHRESVRHETVAERIEIARNGSGTRVLRLFHPAEINEFTQLISGECMRKESWQVVTNDEATKHVLRTTTLHFLNQTPTDDITKMHHNVRPKAIKGDLRELEQRAERLSAEETLKVRLPRPSMAADWNGMRALQEQYGNRLTFFAHKEHRSTEYGDLPIEVHEDERNTKLDVTQEFPSLEPVDPATVGAPKKPHATTILQKGWMAFKKGWQRLWTNS